MPRASDPRDRPPSAAAPRALFQEFSTAISTDTAIPEQVKRWVHARREWRLRWTARGTISAESVFDRLIPGSTSAGPGAWEHPVADEAPELNSWRLAWQAAARAERSELATAFVSALALTDAQPAASSHACAELARVATPLGLPLVVVTTALSSLDPERFVVMCDAWLTTLRKSTEIPVRNDIACYPELNTLVLNWFASAEGDSVAPVFAGSARADRFGMFCSWLARTTAQEGHARFDVTQKKYKDWPPMW